MTPIAAFILGLIQGVTEFLPISSSAHLALLHEATGWTTSKDLVFDIALHFGTLLAILIYFARDWLEFIRRRDRMLTYVLVACIPGAIAGVLLEDQAESLFRNPLQIAALLTIMGLVMAVAERFSRHARPVEDMRWSDALWIGVSQALAIMPGVSRSGITMTTGLFRGLTREAAARFSFLLATPIMLGATLYSARHLLDGTSGLAPGPAVIGILTSALSGLICIHWLLRFLQRHTFYGFVIYRLVLALVVVVTVLVLSPA